MALVIPSGFGSAIFSLRWVGDPEPMAVTLGVQGGATNEDEVITLAGALNTAFGEELMVIMGDDVELVGVELTYQIAVPPLPPLVGTSSDIYPGLQDGTLLPQNSAYLVHKRSSSGGRGGRGRMYLPGVEEVNVDNLGNIVGAFLTVINNAFVAFEAALATEPLFEGFVILHDSEGAFAAAAPNVITSFSADPVIATQRRRLRR